jgi:hypothetical protein
MDYHILTNIANNVYTPLQTSKKVNRSTFETDGLLFRWVLFPWT